MALVSKYHLKSPTLILAMCLIDMYDFTVTVVVLALRIVCFSLCYIKYVYLELKLMYQLCTSNRNTK